MPDPRRWPDRMSATDAVFWTLGRTGAARPATGLLLQFARPVQERRVRSALQGLCDAWPRLRQRVVPVPFDAAPPEWVEDETFVLEQHFRRVEAPGEIQPFLAAVRRRLAQPLPEDRPLWQATLFHRAEAGATALLLNVHHAATEGLGISRLLEALASAHEATPTPVPTSGRTPRLATPDALLWRALQYGLEELGENVTLLPGSVVEALTTPVRRGDDLRRLLTGAVSGWLGSARAGDGDRLAEARQRSRRLLAVEIDVADLAAVCEATSATANEVVATILAAGLANAWDELGRTPRALDVLFPATLAGQPRAALLAATVTPEAEAPTRLLAVVTRLLRASSNERSLRGYGLVARMLQALPAAAVRGVGREWLGSDNAAHLTLAGPAQSIRFAGESVARMHAFPPLVGAPPVALCAHVYRRKLHLGFDIDLHQAPDPADLPAAIGDAWAELRRGFLRPRLR